MTIAINSCILACSIELKEAELTDTGSNNTAIAEQVARLFNEVFHQRQYELLEGLLTPDFTFQYPFPGFSSGAEGIRQFSEMFHTAVPNFELEIHDLFGTNDRAAIRWTLRGRHDGHLLGIPATSRYVSLSAIGIYHGDGDPERIKTGSLEMNTLGMLQQIDRVEQIGTLFPALRQN